MMELPVEDMMLADEKKFREEGTLKGSGSNLESRVDPPVTAGRSGPS